MNFAQTSRVIASDRQDARQSGGAVVRSHILNSPADAKRGRLHDLAELLSELWDPG
jgi:hypothetical protein